MKNKDTTANIADDAVTQLQVAREYLSWFDSLGWAISAQLKEGNVHHADRLAGVAQYLACGYHESLAGEVKSLSDRLNALDVRV